MNTLPAIVDSSCAVVFEISLCASWLLLLHQTSGGQDLALAPNRWNEYPMAGLLYLEMMFTRIIY